MFTPPGALKSIPRHVGLISEGFTIMIVALTKGDGYHLLSCYALLGETSCTTRRKKEIAIKKSSRWRPREVDTTRINERIGNPQIRVVADGEQLGIMTPADALGIARERDMDLVEVSPSADPPVCKIMDYGRYKFENSKKQKEAKKKQSTVSVKEIKMTPLISEHDYDFKIRNIEKFLDEGDRVKVTIRFRGRQMAKPELGMKVLNRIAEELVEKAKVLSTPNMEGRTMIMILSPR